MKKTLLLLFGCFTIFQGFSQYTITGFVRDSASAKPIEGAAVFFDQTSIWTVTNSDGYFELHVEKRTVLPLNISYLGYEKVVIERPFSGKEFEIKMVQAKNKLATVVLKADTSRNKLEKSKKKDHEKSNESRWLHLFKHYFIGKGKASKKIQVKNLESLVFKYDSIKKTVFISATKPLIVENEYLRYRITYQLDTASIGFYKSKKYEMLVPEIFSIAGNSFFQDLLDPEKRNRRFHKRREEAYQGSTLHFMRALKSENLVEEDFVVYKLEKKPGKKGVLLKRPFKFDIQERTYFTEIVPPAKFTIIYNDNRSKVKATQNFGIDALGNFFPWHALTFSVFLGRTGMSTALPLNYEPKEKE